MKSRARRIALLTVAAGCLVIAGLAAALNWGFVSDHAEVWWFQVTTDTYEIKPLPPDMPICLPCPFQGLATQSSHPVIIPAAGIDMDGLDLDDGPSPLQTLRKAGFRVIEQRFPRPAYVVTGYAVR